jgi:hypothetical protein
MRIKSKITQIARFALFRGEETYCNLPFCNGSLPQYADLVKKIKGLSTSCMRTTLHKEVEGYKASCGGGKHAISSARAMQGKRRNKVNPKPEDLVIRPVGRSYLPWALAASR